jgi:hypothetical protein
VTHPRSVRILALSLVLALVPASACGPITEDAPAPAPDCARAIDGHTIDPLKELLIIDDAVVNDAAAKNQSDGVLGFRHAMRLFAPEPDDASAVTLAWLDPWAPAAIRCDWLRARAENGCDATCAVCVERRLDLSLAPFRLIAVANRIDLSEPLAAHSGEGRLVFAATHGAGDDPESAALPITVIFEFRLPGDRAEWASRWHALGAHAAFDADYTLSLASLAEGFVGAEHLAQIRVNDASAGPGTMLEFHLDTAASAPLRRLVQVGLRRTPAHSIDGSEELRAFVTAHEDEILHDRYELPAVMQTSRVDLGGTWALPGIDEPLRHAFAASTCDGCHGTEHPTTNGGFHVAPSGSGLAKLSRFLFDPDHREDDELTRRSQVLARMTCMR